MLTYRYKGRTVPYLNPSSSVAVASSAVVVVAAGIAGAVGIATDTIAPSAVGELSIEGVHELAANSGSSYGETGTQDQIVYWDNSNSWITVTFNSNCTRAGALAQPKNSGDTTCFVKLSGFLTPVGAGALSNVIPDPGNTNAIPVNTSGICYLTSAGTETRTLAAPAGAGISLILVSQSVGAGTITVNSATTNLGSGSKSHAPFSANGMTLELLSIPSSTSAFRWAVMTNDGLTLS